jgi:hypothetical protein
MRTLNLVFFFLNCWDLHLFSLATANCKDKKNCNKSNYSSEVACLMYFLIVRIFLTFLRNLGIFLVVFLCNI